MKFSVLLVSAIQSLKGNARRTILTMIGIIIGIASVITIISLGKGYQKQTISALTKGDTNRVSISVNYSLSEENMENVLSMSPFSSQDMKGLEQIKGVYSVEVPEEEEDNTTSLSVAVRDKQEAHAVTLIQDTGADVLVGQTLSTLDQETYNRVALVSRDIAVDLYGSIENAVGKAVDLNGIPFLIKGVKENPPTGLTISFGPTKANTELEVPANTHRRYFEEKKTVTSLTVFVENGYKAAEVGEAVKNYLNENGSMRQMGTYSYFDMGQILEAIGKVLNSLTYFISAIAGISLFIAGVGVMNMMYISVSERTKEIGIRRSMGATKRSIQLQFLIEGILITFIGGMIGYLVGIGVAKIIAHFLPFDIVIDMGSILFSIGISVFIGIVFSVFPAKSAANKDVIDILR